MNTRKLTPEAEEAIGGLMQLGELTPLRVVQEAADDRSPLHQCFEWDDSKAGHEHRIDQARRIIRSVRVEIKTDERVISAPRYVHDMTAGRNQGYVDVTVIRSDLERARDTVRYELRRALAHMKRSNDVAAALGIHSEMAALIDDATRVLDGIEAGAAEAMAD
jgi:hypothetical protein